AVRLAPQLLSAADSACRRDCGCALARRPASSLDLGEQAADLRLWTDRDCRGGRSSGADAARMDSAGQIGVAAIGARQSGLCDRMGAGVPRSDLRASALRTPA